MLADYVFNIYQSIHSGEAVGTQYLLLRLNSLRLPEHRVHIIEYLGYRFVCVVGSMHWCDRIHFARSEIAQTQLPTFRGGVCGGDPPLFGFATFSHYTDSVLLLLQCMPNKGIPSVWLWLVPKHDVA